MVINVAYLVNEANEELLSGSLASLKANAGDAELNIKVLKGEYANFFSAIKAFENSERLMIVSPYIYFNGAVQQIYTSISKDKYVAGAKNPIACVGEVKRYIRDILQINLASYISNQLMIVNLEKMKAEHALDTYLQLFAEDLTAKINGDEEMINLCFAEKIQVLSRETLAVPGNGIEKPMAVSFAFAGKPWKHSGAEYADIYRRYSTTEGAAGINIRELAAKFEYAYNMSSCYSELSFAL